MLARVLLLDMMAFGPFFFFFVILISLSKVNDSLTEMSL